VDAFVQIPLATLASKFAESDLGDHPKHAKWQRLSDRAGVESLYPTDHCVRTSQMKRLQQKLEASLARHVSRTTKAENELTVVV
jgi:hypothetical protein